MLAVYCILVGDTYYSLDIDQDLTHVTFTVGHIHVQHKHILGYPHNIDINHGKLQLGTVCTLIMDLGCKTVFSYWWLTFQGSYVRHH